MVAARAKPLYEAEAKDAKFAPRQVAVQHRQEGEMSDIRKKRICADEAFAAYMALGPSRTLPRLRERYCRDAGVIPPALSTMKRWSTKDEWTARAREHDFAVQGEASKRTIERQAEQRVEVSLVVEDTLEQVAEMRIVDDAERAFEGRA